MLFSQIRQYVKGILANSFINKSTLDKFGENNNGLTFNGNNIESPQELTSQQMQAIKDAFVIDTPRTGYPIMFDETGAEHVVAWYRYANGTKKPVYQKMVTGLTTSATGDDILCTISNLDKLLYLDGYIGNSTQINSHSPTNSSYDSWIYNDNGNIKSRIKGWIGQSMWLTLQYTKTTDTPQ